MLLQSHNNKRIALLVGLLLLIGMLARWSGSFPSSKEPEFVDLSELVLEIENLEYPEDGGDLQFDLIFRNVGENIFHHRSCALETGGVRLICAVDDKKYEFAIDTEKASPGIGVRLENWFYIQPNQSKRWRMRMGFFIPGGPTDNQMAWKKVAAAHADNKATLVCVWGCDGFFRETYPERFTIQSDSE